MKRSFLALERQHERPIGAGVHLDFEHGDLEAEALDRLSVGISLFAPAGDATPVADGCRATRKRTVTIRAMGG